MMPRGGCCAVEAFLTASDGGLKQLAGPWYGGLLVVLARMDEAAIDGGTELGQWLT